MEGCSRGREEAVDPGNQVAGFSPHPGIWQLRDFHLTTLSLRFTSGENISEMVDPQDERSLPQYWQIECIRDLVWREKAFIRIYKRNPRLFNFTVGHLTSSFVPAVGLLPAYFIKLLLLVDGYWPFRDLRHLLYYKDRNGNTQEICDKTRLEVAYIKRIRR